MPDITADWRHLEPMGKDQPEGPWFTMDAKQVRKLAKIVGDHPHGVKVEFKGSGYWWVTRLDPENKPLDEGSVIWGVETE
jgi:hypothetical protein